MGIASLFNVPGTEDEMNTWAFSHMADHRDIIRAVRNRYGLSLQEFALDPLPVNNMSTWLYQHQIMHNEMNSVFGLTGFNLVGVDIKNQDSLAGFILSNGVEHRAAQKAIAAAGPPASSLSAYLDSAGQSVGAASFSIGPLSFGSPAAGRYLCALISYTSFRGTGTPPSVGGVTIGGVTADIVDHASFVYFSAGGINNSLIGIAACVALVESGSSGNVAVTASGPGTFTDAGCSLYSVVGISSTTPSQVVTSVDISPNVYLDVPASRVVIGGVSSASIPPSGAPSGSWSGLTQNTLINYSVGSRSLISSASKNTTASESIAAMFTATGAAASAGCFLVF